MPMPMPSVVKADCDKARLARTILEAAQRVEDLGSVRPLSFSAKRRQQRSRPPKLAGQAHQTEAAA